MPILISAPANLTFQERNAYNWAVEAMADCMSDADWIADNPGYDTDRKQQLTDLLYRLEEQTHDMASSCEVGGNEWQGARAARRAARKVRTQENV